MFNFRKIAVSAAAGAMVAATAVQSFAVSLLDLTTCSNSITAELGPAITAAMPIAGTLLAVGVGWKLYKRFTK
jgi:uncharacterized membrane protein YqgA involved in biofilm formation